ncbi:MAG: iron ABC transporter permease [Candidatus Hydrogenedentes bacterium]|nr:iron ABC transporter permease [Candidatus Hydrogenedentota bacterium]
MGTPLRIHRRTDRLLLLPVLLVLGAAVAYPAIRLLLEAAHAWDMTVLRTGAGYHAIWNTLFISLASVLTAGMAGSALALVLVRYSFPGRRVLAALAYLPFTLPPLVGVLSFYYLIGRDGIVTRIIQTLPGLEMAEIPGAGAILLVHTYSFYVFFYAMVSAALESIDAAQLEAARTLGAGRLRVFFRVTLPQLMPALSGAGLLTFMSSGASFSAPYFFGGDFPMLSVEIYNARSQFHTGEALTLTVVLACVSLLGVIVFRTRQAVAGTAAKGTRTPIRSSAGRIAAGALCWGLVGLLLVPHIAIVWLSLADYTAWQDELVPTVFTLDNYARIFSESGSLRPILNSAWMSALATMATLAVGLPAAYLVARMRPGGRFVNFLVMIPWALPGTVIAMNLIVAFNDPWLPLYNTIWMLPLAYFIRNIPLLTRMAAAAIEPFDPSLIEAGRTLGGSPRHCFRHITLPLLAPAIGAACALVFALSLGEFVASILLYVPANIPISIRINMEWRSAIGPAFAYSVILMVLVTATFLISRRFSSRMI